MPEIPVEKIIRSSRRTISLEVTPQATLVVRAPRRVPLEYIDGMIREKHAWILRKMEEMRKRPAAPAREYAEGELFWFLGRQYPLHFTDAGSGAIVRTDRLEVCRSLQPRVQQRLERWYRDEAYREIHGRCSWFSMKTGYVPTSVRITGARQRWGSCTHKAGLNFTWRLVQAPPEIVDYVVVHELVHIGQPDHSRKFWNKVGAVLPDYDRRRQWLRGNEWMLKV